MRPSRYISRDILNYLYDCIITENRDEENEYFFGTRKSKQRDSVIR